MATQKNPGKHPIYDGDFNILDVVTAFGASADTTKWVCFRRLTDFIENFAVGGFARLSKEHLRYILEDLESDEIISVNWDSESYITNY